MSERSRLDSPAYLGILSAIALALVVLLSLFLYKWGTAFSAVARAQEAGVYALPSPLIPTEGLPPLLASGAGAINYLAIVWPALVYGILIAGLVRAFISPRNVTMLLGSGVLRQQLVGGTVGMPLMLCSCCIAPVFSSIYERGARLSSALAIMFSSPSLNVAALILTFLLFPPDVALARTAMAIWAVFVLPVFVERLAGGQVHPKIVDESLCPSERVLPETPLGVIRNWMTSSGSVVARTLPMIVLGVYASSLLIGWFQHPWPHRTAAALLIVAVACFAALIALPTFFEIPFGLLLLANGFPPGAVAAILFAGPAINLPSLFTLARVSTRRVALLTFLGVWSIATAGGLLLHFLGT
ncbi:MAG: permease [Acidobacteria bacterium]|nr:permease [Acidobacteriota bacterium]